MPGPAWSIPAELCRIGSILRAKAGSVCSKCYALKGRYVFPNVRAAMARRLARYSANPAGWRDAMAESILKTGTDVFRWLDSGDLQSVAMLRDIAAVAEATPAVDHWLPTRERDTVKAYLQEGGTIPENLTVRLSAAMVGAPLAPAARGPLAGLPVSVVRAKGTEARQGEYRCPAPLQGGKCGACRSCWSRRVAVVSYGAH